MAWIKTSKTSEADKEQRRRLRKLRATFPPEYGKPAPKASSTDESIVDSHSLIPDALYHAFMTMSSLMADELPLTRREQEMIATIVSDENDCFY